VRLANTIAIVTGGGTGIGRVIAALRRRGPHGRRGGTPRGAAADIYLASDEARWVTGVALPVDGGLMAGL
jgi:meso-butanediol dehydrogenase/(S,S)-butanediol dehydrogenase/diacetyl reductase